MSGSPEVERQLREVNAYNLFYSALTARASPCLSTRGWALPLMFGEIEDRFSGVTAKPDFVLYNGDVCLLVEIKAGNNFEERHIRQMERCNELTIDGVEEELRDADVEEKTEYAGDVQIIDSCIVYQDIDEEYIEDCRDVWEECSEKLEDLEEQTAVLTQDYGGSLRHLAGEFESGNLSRLFSQGINLPQNPKEEVVLNEEMEEEVLAIAICDIWGEQVLDHDDPIQTNVNEVRAHFAPRFNIPPERVNRTLYYLQVVGACDYLTGLTYEFSYPHIGEVISIVETVRENSVSDILDGVDEGNIPQEDQSTIDDWNGNESAEDGSR